VLLPSAAVKEAALQRRHHLYRDSVVLSSSDSALQLLGGPAPIDWAAEAGAPREELGGAGGDAQRRRRVKQVVSMIQVEGSPVLCVEGPEEPGQNRVPVEVQSAPAKEEEGGGGASQWMEEEPPSNQEVSRGGMSTTRGTLIWSSREPPGGHHGGPQAPTGRQWLPVSHL